MTSGKIIVLLLMLLMPVQAVFAAPTVLFDQGHGQAFTIDGKGDLHLTALAELLRSDGWQVSATDGVLTPLTLHGAKALVISGPFRPLTQAEVTVLTNFVYNGGRLAIMLHIARPLAPLLTRLGVIHANGVVREGEDGRVLLGDALNFQVVDLKPHPLTQGLQRFSLYGGWPLLADGEGCRSIADTSAKAWVDLDGDSQHSAADATQALSVLVVGSLGRGEFAVFGDDAIFQNRFLKEDNIRLAGNLSRWLQSK